MPAAGATEKWKRWQPGERLRPGSPETPVTGRTMWDAFAEVAAGRAYVMIVLVAAWRCRWFAGVGAIAWVIATFGPELLHRVMH